MITLSNDRGLELTVIERGAVIQALRVPDRYGRVNDVVLGFDDATAYQSDRWFMGCVIGRYANRIREGRFTLDGRTYVLPTNDRGHHLHGGPAGLHSARWTVSEGAKRDALRLAHASPAGEQGYPGTLETEVVYALTGDNALRVDFRAVSDQPTIINLTQHSYFNLGGHQSADILDHVLTVESDAFAPVDDVGIPTGGYEPVAGTAFDFTTPRAIRDGLAQPNEQLERSGGYDHSFLIRRASDGLALAAVLHHPASGRTLSVRTTEPAVHVYTGQFVGPVAGKSGVVYAPFAGLCLETQHFPDSPNRPEFPSTVLRPDREFRATTVFEFGV